jgi:hypothetical protein
VVDIPSNTADLASIQVDIIRYGHDVKLAFGSVPTEETVQIQFVDGLADILRD